MTKICYVLPSGYPSGGNKMCIEHVKRLAKKGHEACISVISKHKDDDYTWLEADNIKQVRFCKKELEKMDYVTATYWETYYYIKNLKLENPEKWYFVQSKEEEFEGDWYRKQLVLQSLMDKEFKIITEAKWLQLYLKETCHRDSILIPNHIELPQNLLLEKTKRHKPIILIEGEATTAWKNVIDGARVARLLRPEYEVQLLTSTKLQSINPWIFHSFDKVHIGLPWKEALETIANADVLYRPSTLEGFNGAISEAMILETPTVCNDIPASHEQGINEYNTLIVQPHNIFQATSTIKRLIQDKELKQKIITNAKTTAEQYFTNWEESINKLETEVYI